MVYNLDMETLSIWFKHAMDNEMSPAFNYVFTENIISLFVKLKIRQTDELKL